jgi:gliding motility-associated-like protein
MLLAQLTAFATHNRAGEITYTAVPGSPNKYKITVITYSKASSQADRCELTVYFGDGDSAVFDRSNGPLPGPTDICSAPERMGVNIGNDTKYNVYEGFHTYPGPGQYWISMLDPNRNGSIENIPNSVNVPFYLRTLLIINSILGPNSSPVLLNPPLDYACTGQCFVHNPGAVDADGDSLSYSIVPCLGDQGNVIPGYTFPPTLGGGTNTIDPYTGDYSWCSPSFSAVGEWNIAILITEYRKKNGQYFIVGQTLRDMQIYVIACANTTPVIAAINDTCIMAGSTLTFQVSSTDPNVTELTATGGPFQTTPPATFVSTPSANATGTFTWTPGCGDIRNQPFQVTFKAEDNHPNIPLTDFETVQIKVVGPPPLNVTASPQGTGMLVDWDPPVCSSVKGYMVYRKDACGTWIPGPCEIGVPASSGYTLIANTAYNVTDFLDNNNGQGLIHGVDYSYFVVAIYGDGSPSFASMEVCARLVRDVPIITHVTVDSTSTTDGQITVRWVKPLADTTNFDTLAHPGPYRFELLRATGFNGSFAPVASFASPFFASLNDTSYVDSAPGFNTLNDPYTYRIDFYFTDPVSGNESLIGSTHTASSVYLTITPADNQLTLNWQENVPWLNYRYFIYKETFPSSTAFVLLDSTTATTYVDSGLVNGATYCYRILSQGEYSDTNITRPLFNYSEIMCAEPQDLTPPCAPALTVLPDCNIGQDYIVWTNPNNSCSDDVVQYNVYYTPVQGQPYQLLTIVPGPVDTDFVYIMPENIAGCFVVTALDTFLNESVYSNEQCVDNCPVYELPNVFTPDGNNVNDLFVPFPYKYVESIDLKIYDRWGVLMFETTDPNIRWDGTNKDTKKPATAGVYYYTCTVNEIRMTGVRQRELKGFIHLLPGNRGE